MEQDAPSSTGLARRRQAAHRWLVMALSALGLAIATLRACPPVLMRFYPACPFHAATGLLCPGCGATRAFAALARGHLLEALRWNALVVAFAAIVSAYLAVAYVRAVAPRPGRPSWPTINPAAIVAATVCAVAFAVARNLL